MFGEVPVRVKIMPWMSPRVYQCHHLCSCSSGWHCLIYCYGHNPCLQEAPWCCFSSQVDFWAKQFKLGSCGGFRRAEARGVLPCSPDLSWADHVCRINAISDSLGLPSQTAKVLEQESPKLPGPYRTSQHCPQRERGGWPALELGCYDCCSRSCEFWA